jgi:hypothetical protein
MFIDLTKLFTLSTYPRIECRRLLANGGRAKLWNFTMVLPHPHQPPGSASKAPVLIVLEALMSTANGAETSEVLYSFKMAIQRLNNNNHLWWPAFVTDVSAVLALAVAMAFNGCTFIEITKEIDRRLSADAAQAQGLRHRFHNCMLQLQNVPTAPVPGTALLTAVAGLDAAGAASAAGLALVTTSGAGAEESFPSFGEPDVLEYQPDHGTEEPQMCLRLREDARQRLQAAIQLAEAQDPVVADPNVLRCAKELVCLKEPTIECLRGITVVLHCRPHKVQMVLRVKPS